MASNDAAAFLFSDDCGFSCISIVGSSFSFAYSFKLVSHKP